MSYSMSLRALAGCLVFATATSAIAQDRRDDRDRNRRSEVRERYDDRYEDASDEERRDNRSNRNRIRDRREREDSARYRNYQRQNTAQDRERDRDRDQQQAALGVMIAENSDGAVRVSRVYRGSPAWEAGLQINDEIVRVDGDRINSPDQLISAVRRKDPGSQIRIQVERDGNQRTLIAQLEPPRQVFNMRPNRGGPRFDRPRRDFNTPHGHDDLLAHIDNLERQVERMRRDITELRSMLNDDPSRRSWDNRTSFRDQRRNRGGNDYEYRSSDRTSDDYSND